MRINLAQPISCGNAVRLVLSPSEGEARWRVLRREDEDFTGHDDPAAVLVHDGDDRFLTDCRLLVNGTTYHYAAYGEVSPGVWSDPVLAAVTPTAAWSDLSIDVQELVRERLDVTLNGMLQRSQIKLTKSSIKVLSIPFYTQGEGLPVVTVLYGNGSSVVRGLGEVVAQDTQVDDAWDGAQGWHAAVTLEITVFSLNADERNVLRRALEAAVAANLSVLEAQGLNMVEVQSVSDTEDTQSMNVPLYQTMLRLGFQHAVVVADEDGLIVDVDVLQEVI